MDWSVKVSRRIRCDKVSGWIILKPDTRHSFDFELGCRIFLPSPHAHNNRSNPSRLIPPPSTRHRPPLYPPALPRSCSELATAQELLRRGIRVRDAYLRINELAVQPGATESGTRTAYDLS